LVGRRRNPDARLQSRAPPLRASADEMTLARVLRSVSQQIVPQGRKHQIERSGRQAWSFAHGSLNESGLKTGFVGQAPRRRLLRSRSRDR
jgi:hypothetical protein